MYLKPILEQAFNNKWPDPSQATTPEQFHMQYTEAYGRANAYKEIFMLLENAGATAINIAEQAKNPAKDYSLGTREEHDKK